MSRDPSLAVRRLARLAVGLVAVSLGTTAASADDGKAPGASKIKLADYQAIYDRILSELDHGRRPAEAEQLKTLLFGSLGDRRSGWYDAGRSRYDWAWMTARFDANRDGQVVRNEFPGSDLTWSRIDRDADGLITADDMDWSPSSDWARQEFKTWKLFLAMDADGDGELTSGEWAGFFDRSNSAHGTVDINAFRALLDPPSGGGAARPVEGSGRRAKRLESVVSGDIASLGAGLQVGDEAPDFTLSPQAGGPPVSLSGLRGAGPVVLCFGSYTCPPYRTLFRGVERLHESYKDRVTFLGVYIREAHPTDGLVNPTNRRIGIAIEQPKNRGERLAVVGKFCAAVKPSFPILVDEMDDRVARAYQGTPNRLYLIDRTGRIVYRSGQGPRGFKPDELGQSIELLLFDDQAPAEPARP
jgi:hypothetical protein